MSKAERMIALLAGVAGIAAALYTLRGGRAAPVEAPPAAQMYHAANNPNGYVWVQGRGWVRTTPSGWERVYSAELFNDGVS